MLSPGALLVDQIAHARGGARVLGKSSGEEILSQLLYGCLAEHRGGRPRGIVARTRGIVARTRGIVAHFLHPHKNFFTFYCTLVQYSTVPGTTTRVVF